jgi:hypothetical protein
MLPALSLLRHLWHELLGHRLPMPDVARHFWYVLEPSTQ